MIIGIAYFAGWHPSDWAIIHPWFHMLDGHVVWGSAYSPLGCLGNLWWQPDLVTSQALPLLPGTKAKLLSC